MRTEKYYPSVRTVGRLAWILKDESLEFQAWRPEVQEHASLQTGGLEVVDDLGFLVHRLQEPAPLGGDTGHDFISVINSGIQGFLATIDGIIIGFFTLLPLIILAVVIYAIYLWRKGKRGAPPLSHPGPAPEKT